MVARALFEKLCLVRFAEEAIVRHYAENEMRTPMHMSTGQEQIAVGVCGALGERAKVFCSYRSHAAYLARTDDVEGFFLELYGRATGPMGGEGGSMHLMNAEKGVLCASAIVAGSIPAAVGAAFAEKSRGTDGVAVVFFGDGAVDEGVFWESLNAASLFEVPVLFVCEDNGLAVHTPQAARRGYSDLVGLIQKHFRCHADVVRSTSVDTVYYATKQLLSHMERTKRPGFIQFECYRYLEHVGVNPDFDAGYRSEADYDQWFKKDCLAKARDGLVASGFTTGAIEGMEQLVRSRVDAAVAAAKEAA